MKSRSISLSLFIGVGVTLASLAAESSSDGPDPREIPLPLLTASELRLPSVDELPIRPEMPDALAADASNRITSPAEWPQRREEIRRILEHYAVGTLPPSPGNVKGRELRAETVLNGTVRYRLIHLTFGPEDQLSLDVGLFTPVSEGPSPVVIMPAGTPPGAVPLRRLPPGPGQGKGVNALLAVGAAGNESPPAPTPPRPAPTAEDMAAKVHFLFERGYAYAVFNHNDCGEDTTLRNADGSWAFRTTRFFPAYTNYEWGLLGGWAWGVSRIIDYLETDSAIDRTKIIVSGVSRTGKSALIAGAFDERIALTAPVVSGGGGVGAYRFSGMGRGGKEGLGDMMRKYPNWFSPHLRPFWGHVDQLPFDQHWFLALVAPRAFIALEGTTDGVSLEAAVKQSFLSARPVYRLLGAADQLGVNYANHGHALTDDDWIALMDFADTRLRGKTLDRRFDQFPSDAVQSKSQP